MDLYKKYLNILEFNKILDMLGNECSNKIAIDLVNEIKPTSDIEEVNRLLKETSEASCLEARFGSPSFRGVSDIRPCLVRASFGSYMTMGELLKVARTLKSMRLVKNYRKNAEVDHTFLDHIFNNLFVLKNLEDEIFKSIISEEEMADDASAELLNIRRKIKANSARIREKLDKFIHSATYQKYLQEPIVTMRGDRFVIPVKLEYKNEINGLIHDTSSSGATVFIEPISVVNANNEIRMLKSSEKEEIDKILEQLSQKVVEHKEEILNSIESFVRLEVIFAKANLSYKMKATTPVINAEGKIKLKKARHPLIDKNKVVPTDINLGYEFDSLIITGPNTGGKTVSLKTVGLITLMAMSGLMIPAEEGSIVSIFDKILPDIGDEQSIEQSLSTFSSHITNIVKIIESSTKNSLILLDELGAGTDPIEGASLAISILEYIREKGIRVICTTHYAELKEYAIKTERVENACCEFNIDTLRPTYKLLIGVPGKSNAFVISEKLGLDKKIVEGAKQLISEENRSFEDVISAMEEKRILIDNKLKEIENLKAEAEKIKADAEIKSEKLLSEAEQEVNCARNKAQLILSNTRAQADIILNELDNIKENESFASKMSIKSKLKGMEEYADPIDEKKATDYKLPRKLKKGDKVLVVDINKNAIVNEAKDNNDTIEVLVGSMRMRVKLDNVKLIGENKVKKDVFVTKKLNKTKKSNDLLDIDLRGQNALDAIMELDSFIDSCVVSGIHQITIIHGKGTGVLRKEISKHLKNHPSIDSFRLGSFGEGESGVTIATLK